ncbi:MAG: metallophosphoesterase family protein [Candidatus Micrarchaeia archaeon]
MKIAIFSDTHFGFSFGGFTKEDSFIQAQQVVEKILKEDVDSVIIAGDIFDTDNPDSSSIYKGFKILQMLALKDYKTKIEEVAFRNKEVSEFPSLPIIAIPATHERKALGEEDIVEVLQLAGILINANNKWITLSKNDERISLLGIGGMEDMQFKEFLEKEREKIEEEAKTKKGFKIFLFHQSIKEFMPFLNDFISLSELPKGFDLYVCGHIHKKIEARVHGKMFLIPGSTVLTQQKKDEEERKGFIIFDTSKYSYKFIEIDSRPFFYRELNFESSTPNEIFEKTKEEIKRILESERQKERKPIIKIKVNATLKEGFKPKDVQLSQLQKEEGALISIEKSINAKEVEVEIEKMRELIKKGDIKDIGLQMLREELKKLNFKLNESILLNLLSKEGSRKEKEENLEKAIKYIKEFEKEEVEKRIKK